MQQHLLCRVIFQTVTNKAETEKISKTQTGKKNNEICTITYILLQILILMHLHHKS